MLTETSGVVSPTRAKSVYRARSLRWASMKQSSGKSLAKVIDKEEFNFRPYMFVPTGIHRVQIFKEVSLDLVLVLQLS